MKKKIFYKNPTKILLTFSIFLFFISILFFKFYSNTNKPSNFDEKIAKDLTQEEYLKVRESYKALLEKENPRVALNKLREEIKTNDGLSRSCHEIVHALGHEAYMKYSDFAKALEYQDEVCNSGYLHGIIESHFSTTNNIFDTINSVCSNYDAKKFIGWECYHGVGHGLMFYTSNDLNKSISLCESYKDSTKSSSCTNGVFMENFNTNQKIHPSDYLDKNNPFYPCNLQNEKYKSDCYTYAPTYYLSLNKNDYSKALDWCKGAEQGYDTICSFGVGSQIIKENINNPKLVEDICMHADKNLISSCISGMVNLYINHFGNLEPAESLCNKLEESNKLSCKNTVRSMQSLF